MIADIGDVTGKPYATRSVIELYWGAAFHWIAYGTQRKHGKHKENHTKLARYLRDLGEPTIGGFWDSLENTRAGGMYGNQIAPLMSLKPEGSGRRYGRGQPARSGYSRTQQTD